jgi:hypothetical protein
MIDLESLLFQAYTLGLQSEHDAPALTKIELRSKLLANVPLFGSVSESTTNTKVTAPKEKAEKKTKTKEPAEKKARAVPDEDTRCCARSLYEADHLENGVPKVMRDDEANPFGGRCKFKKVGDSGFCKHHAEKQPHGVWDGEYAGKMKTLLEKPAENAEKPKAAKKIVKKAATETAEPTTPNKPTQAVEPKAPKKVVKKAAPKEEDEDDVEEHEDDEYMAGDVLEQAGIEYEWVEIDDEQYMIDSNGNVYNPEDETKIGVYDIKAKKWISGGPVEDAE